MLGLLLFMSAAGAQAPLPAGSYVRADAGVGFERNFTFRDVNPSAANCDLCGALFPTTTGASAIVGVGAGYRISPIFRADLTIDYLPATRANGHSTAALQSTGSSDLDSLVGLVNGYVDFAGFNPDRFGSFQPYVTAGIGVARNHFGATTGVSGVIGPFTISDSTQRNFAWALGAGIAYALTPRLTLDLAYRYMNLGEVRTGGAVGAGGAVFELTPSKTADLIVDTVTLGLRYGF
jgi:opacity protein-like surface antigen